MKLAGLLDVVDNFLENNHQTVSSRKLSKVKGSCAIYQMHEIVMVSCANHKLLAMPSPTHAWLLKPRIAGTVYGLNRIATFALANMRQCSGACVVACALTSRVLETSKSVAVLPKKAPDGHLASTPATGNLRLQGLQQLK